MIKSAILALLLPLLSQAFMVATMSEAPKHKRTVAKESRREVLQGVFTGSAAALGLSLVLSRPSSAIAFPFGNGDDVTAKLEEVAKNRQKVEEVIQSLKKKELKGGRQDSAVVLRYADTYFKPLQESLTILAPRIAPNLEDEEKRKRLETLPLLLTGHMFELAQAIKTGDAKEQLQEVEEVAETVDEFLASAATKYQVKSYLGAQEWDVRNNYGPFSCEWWGKQRKPDSNICVDPSELGK